MAAGLLLLAGFWTPIAAVLAAVGQSFLLLAQFSPERDDIRIRAILVIVAASVAMLGPGAWSVDARRFGRQRIDIDRTRGGRSYH